MQEVWRRLLFSKSCYEPHLFGKAVDGGVDKAGGPAEDVGGQMEAALLRGRQRVHHSWTERAKVTKFEGLKI